MRQFLKSAQAAERGPKTKEELPDWPPRGESVVREFLKSAQAAERGPKPKEELSDWPPRGESVVREFLRKRLARSLILSRERWRLCAR